MRLLTCEKECDGLWLSTSAVSLLLSQSLKGIKRFQRLSDNSLGKQNAQTPIPVQTLFEMKRSIPGINVWGEIR